MPFKSKDEPFPLPRELYPADWFCALSLADIFPDRPAVFTEIDIGCGEGAFLIAMAREHPERNFLGVERLLGRVRKVCKRTGRNALTNVVAFRCETGYALDRLLPAESMDRAHLLFPDPWPKRKHLRRRQMCQPDFLRAVHRLLKPGGEFLFKTDHEGYHAAAATTVSGIDFFERLEWPEDAFFYPETDFERLWRSEGRRIQGIRLRKSAGGSP